MDSKIEDKIILLNRSFSHYIKIVFVGLLAKWPKIP